MDLEMIKLRMPVAVGALVTQGFGENPQVYARFGQAGHNGIDFGVDVGTHVYAAADGMVEKVGFDAQGYGQHIRISHGENGEYVTLYAHLSQPLVVKKDKVWAGEVIGLSGNSGYSTGPHLHFELRTPGDKLPGYPQGARNPAPFFVAQHSAPGGTPNQNPPNWEGSITEAYALRAMSVSARMGANIRLSPGGRIIGALAYGSGLVEARGFEDQAYPDWLPVVCWVHESVVTNE